MLMQLDPLPPARAIPERMQAALMSATPTHKRATPIPCRQDDPLIVGFRSLVPAVFDVYLAKGAAARSERPS